MTFHAGWMNRLSAILLSLLLPFSARAAELDSRLYWNVPLSGEPVALSLEVGEREREGEGFRPEMMRFALDGSALDVLGLGIVRGGEARLGADVDVSIVLWSVLGIGAGVAVGFAIASDSVCLSYNSTCDDDDDHDHDDDPAPVHRVGP